jgi:hypothetical protein
MSVDEFFYDESTLPYEPLPDNDLNQSPCHHIIAEKEGYYYCKLHLEITNVHLESIEHHIKFKDPEMHKAELLKFPQLVYG